MVSMLVDVRSLNIKKWCFMWLGGLGLAASTGSGLQLCDSGDKATVGSHECSCIPSATSSPEGADMF